MAKPLNELRERLLRAGVAPRHVRRYLAELADHLADLRAEEERAGRSRADAESAALARLGGVDNLAKAMIEQRQFQSWCVRAPWAMFCLAPPLPFGWDLLRCLCLLVVWLEDFSARSRDFQNLCRVGRKETYRVRLRERRAFSCALETYVSARVPLERL